MKNYKKVKDIKKGDLLYFQRRFSIEKLTVNQIIESRDDPRKVFIKCDELSYYLGGNKDSPVINILGEFIYVDKKYALMSLYEIKKEIDKSIRLLEQVWI